MRLSVFLHHVREAARERGWTLPQALKWVRSLGISLVEVDGGGEEDCAALRAVLDGEGFGVSSVYRMFGWERGELSREDLALTDIAAALGSPLIMPIPALYPSAPDSPLCAREDECIAAAMRTYAAEARARGLRVTIEDYDNARSPIATMAGMQRLLGQTEGLTVTLDTGNFFFSGEDVLEAQRLFAGRIAHVHLKDRLTERPAGMPEDLGLRCPDGRTLWACAVGDGVIPIGEVLRGLKAAGYDGTLTIEHFGAAAWAETIARSAENVRRLTGDV